MIFIMRTLIGLLVVAVLGFIIGLITHIDHIFFVSVGVFISFLFVYFKCKEETDTYSPKSSNKIIP